MVQNTEDVRLSFLVKDSTLSIGLLALASALVGCPDLVRPRREAATPAPEGTPSGASGLT
jgi:hypothetical protein